MLHCNCSFVFICDIMITCFYFTPCNFCKLYCCFIYYLIRNNLNKCPKTYIFIVYQYVDSAMYWVVQKPAVLKHMRMAKWVDRYVFSTVFQSIISGQQVCVQWNSVYGWKDYCRQRDSNPGTARSAGQLASFPPLSYRGSPMPNQSVRNLSLIRVCQYFIHTDFNGSNTNGSFTTAVSNSFLRPLEKIP